jgi:ribulose 1,5-bisphosphate carboxylase large subunit-like protein
MGLAGSNILKHSMGIGAGVEAMYQATEAWKKKIPVDKYARDHEELKVALKMG